MTTYTTTASSGTDLDQLRTEFEALVAGDANVAKAPSGAYLAIATHLQWLGFQLARRASPQPVAVDEYKVTERLLNRSAFISGLTYEMYEAEVSDLHSTIVRLRAALEDIAQPADAGCGCSFPCRCNTPEAEAINAEAMRDIASAALTHHPSVPVQEQSDKVDERARFEAWLRSRWPNAVRPIDEKTVTGSYAFTENNLLWEAWQARARQSCPPVQAGAPVGYLFGNTFWERTNPRITDEVKKFGFPLYAGAAHPAQDGEDARDALIAAVRKLVKAKGRYHTEQNYMALVAALDGYDVQRAATQQGGSK